MCTMNDFKSLMINTKRRWVMTSLGGKGPTSSFVGSGDSLVSIHEQISKVQRPYLDLVWSYLKWIDHTVRTAQFKTFEVC